MSAVQGASRLTSRVPVTYAVTLVPVAAALNIVGGTINKALGLPTFLDMIGTAVVAMLLGPWWGALVGAITNTGLALIIGPTELPFALANMAGALVWGYGVRWGLGATIPRFFLLNVLVAFAVNLVATPIAVIMFGGATGHASDAITAFFTQVGNDLYESVFAASLIVSLADKIIAGFVALAIIDALPASLSAGVRLPTSTGLRGVLFAAAGVAVGVGLVFVFLLLPQRSG